ncbi:MAG TPA: ATP-grasp domain-containing protein [Beijerinckiaceae bacterium]|nr:ATP-grasp domain-containing protein [Beijerinckiaceae bacterium]
MYLTHDHPIAGFSRYTTRHLGWPGPDDPNASAWLMDLATQHNLRGWVLFPGGDSEVRLIAQNHRALASVFRLTTPPWAAVRWALDKRLTHQHAASAGVDSPWSFYPRGRDDVARGDSPFPVILKPIVRASRNAFTDAKAWRADDLPALLARYDEAAALVEPSAIGLQELIPGGGEAQFSYAAVWADGAPVAWLVARRTRQYPIDFGFTSTYVETVERPEVQAAACRFLAPLAFSGMVEIEFKFDARDGRHKLLDVNMRPWTWIALGAAAGVDFPFVQWQVAQGRSVASAVGRPGVAWTHVSRDAAAAVSHIASGALSLRSYWRSLRRPTAYAAYASDDLIPGLIDLPLVAARLATRFCRKSARSFPQPQRPNGKVAHLTSFARSASGGFPFTASSVTHEETGDRAQLKYRRNFFG